MPGKFWALAVALWCSLAFPHLDTIFSGVPMGREWPQGIPIDPEGLQLLWSPVFTSCHGTTSINPRERESILLGWAKPVLPAAWGSGCHCPMSRRKWSRVIWSKLFAWGCVHRKGKEGCLISYTCKAGLEAHMVEAEALPCAIWGKTTMTQRAISCWTSNPGDRWWQLQWDGEQSLRLPRYHGAVLQGLLQALKSLSGSK